MGNSGIYQIRNLVNGKIYVGQSVDLYKRKHTHFSMLRWDYRSENVILRKAYKKYGEENFVFEVLVYCEPHELTRYEQGLVDGLNPAYNIRRECMETNKGVAPSKEHRDRISAARMGHEVSEITRRILATYTGEKNGKFGKPVSEETRTKLSIAASRQWADESKRLRGEKNPMFGKKMSAESRKKMSDSAKHRKKKETE